MEVGRHVGEKKITHDERFAHENLLTKYLLTY